MATVNFSVPDEVKAAFNRTFEGRNKSAIIAELMTRAVEAETQKVRRARAMDELLRLREETPPVPGDRIRAARDEVRGWP